MVSSFSQLKKSRKKVNKKLAGDIEKANEKNSYVDERFWKPIPDNDGNFKGTIRFIGPAPGEDEAWVQTFKHFFQDPETDRWYSENCLSTIDKDDPVNDYNRELWAQGFEEQARRQKRKMQYISNILVVDDPSNPENNGKVFLFEYGKQIFDKIQEAMFPEIEEDEPVQVFDFWEGAPFKLIRKMKDKTFPTYESSKFLDPEEIAEDEKEMEKIYNSQYKLFEFIDPDNTERFKSYDELKKKLDYVLNTNTSTATSSSPSKVEESEELDDYDMDLEDDEEEEDIEVEGIEEEDDDDDDLSDLQDLVD